MASPISTGTAIVARQRVEVLRAVKLKSGCGQLDRVSCGVPLHLIDRVRPLAVDSVDGCCSHEEAVEFACAAWQGDVGAGGVDRVS